MVDATAFFRFKAKLNNHEKDIYNFNHAFFDKPIEIRSFFTE